MEDNERDHGHHILKDCFWAVIEEYEDGYILCPLNLTGMPCEECINAFLEMVGE